VTIATIQVDADAGPEILATDQPEAEDETTPAEDAA
jgi:hypothetical protein